MNEDGVWRIRRNDELEQLYGDPGILVKIKKAWLRWAGHVQKIPDTRVAKKVFLGRPGGRRMGMEDGDGWRKTGMNGGRLFWRPRSYMGCSAEDDDDDDM